ncbi:MAG TPA: thioredoxin [Candidatus Kryptonia bacterium]|nr:thioredoxin [Candidatus Kryptonia bacterium]
MAGIIDVTDNSFDAQVLQADQPVLVDFWAPHCSACRALFPTVDAIANEYAGQLKVVKINTDDNPMAPSRYGVRAIPNMLLFKRGAVQAQIIGNVPKMKLVKAVEQLLG